MGSEIRCETSGGNHPSCIHIKGKREENIFSSKHMKQLHMRVTNIFGQNIEVGQVKEISGISKNN